MKLSKHVKSVNGGDCFDRISSLPDELLGHMLSFLPTRFAVSTSILSTRWRYLFTLTNCLSFEDAPSIDLAAQRTRFKKFVYNVLELNKISPIKKFNLVCRDCYDESDLNAWLSFAVQKGVQELHYRVNGLNHVVCKGIFTCETLVTLKMSNYYGYCYLKIPVSAWLPKLKILHLESFLLSDDSADKLFSRCELVEELTLKSCSCYTSCHVIVSTALLKVLTIENVSFRDGLFEIDAPNLALLTYSKNIGVKIVPSWEYLCSLVEAKLNFDYPIPKVSDVCSLLYDCGLLKAAAYKVTDLCLFSHSSEHLLKLDENEQMPVYFYKFVFQYLDCSDNDHVSPNEPLLPFSCEAKVIEVHGVCLDEGSLKQLGNLLKNARLLKKVVLYEYNFDDIEKDLQICKDLLMFTRASKDCCIHLNFVQH